MNTLLYLYVDKKGKGLRNNQQHLQESTSTGRKPAVRNNWESWLKAEPSDKDYAIDSGERTDFEFCDFLLRSDY